MLKLLDKFCIKIIRTNVEQSRAIVRDFNCTKKSEGCCSSKEINALDMVWEILKRKKRGRKKVVLIIISCCSVMFCLTFLGALFLLNLA